MAMDAPTLPSTAPDVLTVHCDGRPYALPLAMVLDVCRTLPLLTVPGAPAHILGMAAWRGRVVPCIGLHHLGLATMQTVQRQFVMVVLRLSQGDVAVAVEAPVEVVTWPPPAPDQREGARTPRPAMAAMTALDLERLLPRYGDVTAPRAPASEAPQTP